MGLGVQSTSQDFSIGSTAACLSGIRAALFYDVGNVWGPDEANRTRFDPTDLRHGAGLGFRWNSPFGPIRVDYGVKLDQKKGESFGNFNFSVGSAF